MIIIVLHHQPIGSYGIHSKDYEFIYKMEEKAQEISKSTWFNLKEYNDEDSVFTNTAYLQGDIKLFWVLFGKTKAYAAVTHLQTATSPSTDQSLQKSVPVRPIKKFIFSSLSSVF